MEPHCEHTIQIRLVKKLPCQDDSSLGKNYVCQLISRPDSVAEKFDAQVGSARIQKDFLTQSELIESVSPQAAQLRIHFFYFFFHFTQLEMQPL